MVSPDVLADVLGVIEQVVFRYRIQSPTSFSYEFFSEASHEVWGYSPAQLTADPLLWYSRVHPRDRDASIDPAITRVSAGAAVTVDYRFFRADGELRDMRSRLVPRPGGDGTLVVTGTAWDTTVEKRRAELARYTEDQLHRAERLAAVGVAASRLTHELRNPLTYVTLNLERLEEALAGPRVDRPHLTRMVADCLDGARRMSDIMDGFRSATRAGPSPAEADLTEVCRTAARVVAQSIAPLAELQLTPGPPRRVRGSPVRLGQVVVNLLTNAAHAISQGDGQRGRIVLELDDEPGHAIVRVGDSGPGVPEHLAGRIFDELFSTRAEGGLGLGLAISRQVVEELGGSISVGRSTLGGASFTVRLPRADAAP